MDYCKEEGEERRAVYVTLIDEVNTAGVPSHTDNDSMCGARGGLKSPETFIVDTFLCAAILESGGKTRNRKICFWPHTEMTAALKLSCILPSSRQGYLSP